MNALRLRWHSMAFAFWTAVEFRLWQLHSFAVRRMKASRARRSSLLISDLNSTRRLRDY